MRDKVLTTGGSIILHIFESIDRNRTSIRAPLFDDILRALAIASADTRAQSITSPLVTSPVVNLQPDKDHLFASSSDQQFQDQRNKPQYPLVIEGEKSKIQSLLILNPAQHLFVLLLYRNQGLDHQEQKKFVTHCFIMLRLLCILFLLYRDKTGHNPGINNQCLHSQSTPSDCSSLPHCPSCISRRIITDHLTK